MATGVVAFFITETVSKESNRNSGFDFTAIGASLRHKNVWFWMTLPLAMSAPRVIGAKLFVPAYSEHEASRAGAFVATELTLSSAIQFFVFALGTAPDLDAIHLASSQHCDELRSRAGDARIGFIVRTAALAR